LSDDYGWNWNECRIIEQSMKEAAVKLDQFHFLDQKQTETSTRIPQFKSERGENLEERRHPSV
jgi:hypothetical protein